MPNNRTEELAYWINNRELMRERKERGDAPSFGHGWHADIYMGAVRYCNVRREDDKVTRWLADTWRLNFQKPHHYALARFVNWIPTLRMLAEQDLDDLYAVCALMKHLRQGGQIWGNAYTVSTNGRSMDKVDYIIWHVLDPMMKAPTWHADTLKEMYSGLTQYNGVGSFMAGQMVADMKNTKGHPLEGASDWHAWATHGPGSLRGLSEYFHAGISPNRFKLALETAYKEVRPLLTVGDLHMQDFQNCMCEFSKFMRVKKGGHVRNRYSW